MHDIVASAHGQTEAPDVRAGALNLLRNCVGVEPGDRVLIVGEEGKRAFFDLEVCDVVADVARDLGATAKVVVAPPTRGPAEFPTCLAAAMRQAEHTIFFARIGDQVRFSPLPSDGSKTMCYTHDTGYLGDAFARTDYRLFEEVLTRLMREIGTASACRITCPAGTDLSGTVGGTEAVASDFTVKLFPVMIFPPLSCAGLSGRLALGRWLTSTSTTVYDGSLMQLDAPVFARIDKGRITGFEGDGDWAGRIDRHFRAVAGETGVDPYEVHSWHTGIYPKTYYRGEALAEIEKWGDLVFGSPRYTHFHMCGKNPGDICASVFDATISLDDEAFWEDGRFTFLDRPEIQVLRERYPGCGNAFEMRRDIGI